MRTLLLVVGLGGFAGLSALDLFSGSAELFTEVLKLVVWSPALVSFAPGVFYSASYAIASHAWRIFVE